jgi:hypothetical protein
MENRCHAAVKSVNPAGKMGKFVKGVNLISNPQNMLQFYYKNMNINGLFTQV